jgi:hypothetical protein
MIPGWLRVFAALAFALINIGAQIGARAAPAEPVAPTDIQVIDGGTIRARGATVHPARLRHAAARRA